MRWLLLLRASLPRRRISVFVLFGLTLAGSNPGCEFDPLNSYTRRKPAREAIAGVWTLEEAGWDSLRFGGKFNSRPTLTLAVDGTCVARDIPDWWNRSEAVAVGAVRPAVAWTPNSGAGTWEFQKVVDYWAIQIHFQSLTPEAEVGGVQIDLYGQGPPYHLIVSIGDPDLGVRLVFTKVS